MLWKNPDFKLPCKHVLLSRTSIQQALGFNVYEMTKQSSWVTATLKPTIAGLQIIYYKSLNTSWHLAKLTSGCMSDERSMLKKWNVTKRISLQRMKAISHEYHCLKGCDAKCSCSHRLRVFSGFPEPTLSQDKLSACRFIHINCDWKKIRRFQKKYAPHSDLIIMSLIVSASEEWLAFGGFFFLTTWIMHIIFPPERNT